jgi:hypothetical protein
MLYMGHVTCKESTQEVSLSTVVVEKPETRNWSLIWGDNLECPR